MSVRPDHLHAVNPLDRVIDIDPSWLDFGSDDPLEAARWINPCAVCSEEPPLEFNGERWQVLCSCGQCGTPGQLAAIAAVNWNKSPLSRHPHYETLPFFALEGLSVPRAREKLIRIREYLEEQKRRCERRVRAREPFGHRYFQRIRAYLAWAIYAQGLVREAENALFDDVAENAPRVA
ncbi:hypothetical protein [Lysobacter sp. HA18]